MDELIQQFFNVSTSHKKILEQRDALLKALETANDILDFEYSHTDAFLFERTQIQNLLRDIKGPDNETTTTDSTTDNL